MKKYYYFNLNKTLYKKDDNSWHYYNNTKWISMHEDTSSYEGYEKFFENGILCGSIKELSEEEVFLMLL